VLVGTHFNDLSSVVENGNSHVCHSGIFFEETWAPCQGQRNGEGEIEKNVVLFVTNQQQDQFLGRVCNLGQR
jgi:hypothetical protein